MQGLRVHITGIVQGVGFRPFVYNLAGRYKLNGWVRNTSAGVDIEVDGPQPVLQDFLKALEQEPPPLARIDSISPTFQSPNGFTTFEIFESEAIPEAFQPISPDMAICEDCLRELFDPQDRRYRYPFINCTNCGPRFTIIKDIPYDRPKTTMAEFVMCADCEHEYRDPKDRRFHAQPVACPRCGPQVSFELKGARPSQPNVTGEQAIWQARQLLQNGGILAVKGLGGFHLACDASNTDAVLELRRRKGRVDKPFALMISDIETVESHCFTSQTEIDLLRSPARPIVLLQHRPDSKLAREVAPGQDRIGVMLPYTPLHYLLLEKSAGFPEALVMTSGNLSEEPIATENEEAQRRLASLADAFLMHNRSIHIRCDDSVVRIIRTGSQVGGADRVYPIRRSRGYAPYPVKLPWNAPQLLATGGELKNTFCMTNRQYAFMSHHIGDLENYETLRSFEQGVEHFEQLFRIRPEAVAYDLHPDYLSTRYALERAGRDQLTAIGVQHHHAHVAACMADNGLDGSRPVIGVAFDGTGFGEDGAIWGGEFLIADYKGYERALHMDYFPLPGGDAAIKQPARTALALLASLQIAWDERLASTQEFKPDELEILRTQLERGINSPPTSSLGRIFDAAASLCGVRQRVNYEAQAAIEFEALVDGSERGAYPFEVEGGVIVLRGAFEALLADLASGTQIPVIAARFHNGIARMVAAACGEIRTEKGLREVVLSGGVWQNITLLGRTLSLLQKQGFQVYLHGEVPANDGGLSLGQAAIAASRLRG